jgi:hypothetical protein
MKVWKCSPCLPPLLAVPQPTTTVLGHLSFKNFLKVSENSSLPGAVNFWCRSATWRSPHAARACCKSRRAAAVSLLGVWWCGLSLVRRLNQTLGLQS